MPYTIHTAKAQIRDGSGFFRNIDVFSGDVEDAKTAALAEVAAAKTTALSAINAQEQDALKNIDDRANAKISPDVTNDEVEAMLAPIFDTATAYTAGTYVRNADGSTNKLYRLTADHAAGVTWVDTSKVEVKVGSQVIGLKSALNHYLNNPSDVSGFTHKYIINNSNNWATGTATHLLIPVDTITKITLKANANKQTIYAFLTNALAENNQPAPFVEGTTRVPISTNTSAEIDVPNGAKYLYLHNTVSNDNYLPVVLMLDGIDFYKTVNQHLVEVYNAISDINDGIIESSKKITQTSAIGAMVDVAETHFNMAYADGKNLVYDFRCGIFDDSPTSNGDVTDSYDNTDYIGVPATYCSAFIQTLFKGITYNRSRYVKTQNYIAPWGYTSDGSGNYTKESHRQYDMYLAADLLAYAREKGFGVYEITADRPQVRPGDIVWPGGGNGHVALVVQVGYANNMMWIIESVSTATKRDGLKVGVRTVPVSITAYQYGARFPILPAQHDVLEIFSKYNFIVPTTTNIIYRLSADKRSISYPSGFYTMIVEGDLYDVGAASFAITDIDGNTVLFQSVDSGYMKCCTVYIDRPFTDPRVVLNAAQATDLTINKVALYKGYYDL